MPADARTPRHRTPRRRGGAMIRLVVALVVILGGAGAVVFAMSRPSDVGVEETALYQVQSKSFDITLVASGDLQAAKETVLRSELESQASIVEIVDEGSRVDEGDVLVVLSTDDIQKDLDSQLLGLEEERSEVISAENAVKIQESDNESGRRKADLAVRFAELELQKWRDGDDTEQRRQLALNIDAAEREAERLTEKHERSVRLHAREFLSSDELKRDELAKIKAESDLEKALLRQRVYETYERQMKETRLLSDLEEARAEVERVARRNQSQLASKEANLTNRRRQLARREERVDRLQRQIEAATIRAPTAGLVVYATSVRRQWWGGGEGPLQVGSRINPNQDIIVLPNNESMVAQVKVHESLVGKIKPGQQARVRVDAARGTTFTGEVESVGVIAESGGWRDPNLREYEVKIALDLDNADHGLKPSMRAEGDLIVGRVEESLAVPLQAVFFEEGESFVYTPTGSRFERTTVRVGQRSDSFAEILSGLAAGDRVLLREPTAGEILTPREQPAVASGEPSQPGGADVVKVSG